MKGAYMSDLIVRQTSNPAIEQSAEAFNPAEVTMPAADADFTTRETHNENDLSGHTGKNADYSNTAQHQINEGFNGDDTTPEKHILQDDCNYGSKPGGEHFVDNVAGYAKALSDNAAVRAKVDTMPLSSPQRYVTGGSDFSELQSMPCDIDLPKPHGTIKMHQDNAGIKMPTGSFITQS